MRHQITTQARRLRSLAQEHLGVTLSSIQALQLTSRMHGYRDWQTARAVTAPQAEQPARLYLLSYAADTSSDGLYMSTPRVFTTRKEAFDAARTSLHDNIYIDAGHNPDDNSDETLEEMRREAMTELDDAWNAGQDDVSIHVCYVDSWGDNTSDFTVMISAVSVPPTT